MRLILVRHGETLWNRERRIQGCRSDTELSMRGKEQAEKIALSLKSQKVDRICSSTLKRAMDTACAVAYHGYARTLSRRFPKTIYFSKYHVFLFFSFQRRACAAGGASVRSQQALNEKVESSDLVERTSHGCAQRAGCWR